MGEVLGDELGDIEDARERLGTAESLVDALAAADDWARLLSAIDARKALPYAEQLAKTLTLAASRPFRQSSWLLELPDAIVCKILAMFSFFDKQSLLSAALACKALADHVRSPDVYSSTSFNAARLLKKSEGDVTPVFAALSHPRFGGLRSLRLRDLSCTATNLINKSTYRASLPQPAWWRLEHLLADHPGVNATVAHVISVLPPTLRTLSFRDAGGNWIKRSNLEVLADRCPALEALDLGWAKASDPWPVCLETLAARLPNLLALDIAYSGYGSGDGRRYETAADLEALLVPIRRLRELRFLNVSFLGLDGTRSHRNTRSNPNTLLDVIAELPALRWLVHTRRSDRDRADIAAADAFVAMLRARFPAVNSVAALKLNEECKAAFPSACCFFGLAISGQLRAADSVV